MKFIHTSDLHLGVRPDAGPEYTKRRPEEIWETFKSILDRCEDEQIDLLLISGDVFHRQPLLRELKELNAMFAGLSHTKVVFTAGNHDYLKPNSMYRNFKWAGNVVPLLEGRLLKVEFPEFRTAVSGFSYLDRELQGGIRVEWKCVRSMENEILLLHGGDEKHLSFKRAEVDLLGYDYTALGHIHKPDPEITGKCRYSGSPEPTDPNDTGKRVCDRNRREWRSRDGVCSCGKAGVHPSGYSGGRGHDRPSPSGYPPGEDRGKRRGKYVPLYTERTPGPGYPF